MLVFTKGLTGDNDQDFFTRADGTVTIDPAFWGAVEVEDVDVTGTALEKTPFTGV